MSPTTDFRKGPQHEFLRRQARFIPWIRFGAQLEGCRGTRRSGARHRPIAFFFPGPTLLSLVTLFALYLIIDGVLRSSPPCARRSSRNAGAISPSKGSLAYWRGSSPWPCLTLPSLFFIGLLAAWAIVSGALELRAAYNLETDHGRWWLAAGGAISIIFGIWLILAPRFGALAVSWWFAAYASFFGASLVALAFQLRKRQMGQERPEIANRL